MARVGCVLRATRRCAATKALRRVAVRGIRSGPGPRRDRPTSCKYFEWWHALLLYSDAIARMRGKPFFQFVQPNQDDRGSKPLSNDARDVQTRNTAWFDEATPRYEIVGRMSERLRDEGVDATFSAGASRACARPSTRTIAATSIASAWTCSPPPSRGTSRTRGAFLTTWTTPLAPQESLTSRGIRSHLETAISILRTANAHFALTLRAPLLRVARMVDTT